MKYRPLLWILPFFALGVASLEAVESVSRNYGAEMSVNADVQADFFKRYPDLQDEPEVVAAAARTLAAEGVETQDTAKAAELLAQRTRALLERRTPQEWQRKAVQLFPELGVEGSELNTLFVRHYNNLKQTTPQFLEEPSWPVLLARRCADELHPRAPATAVVAPPKKGARAAIPAVPLAAQPTPRASWWISLLNFCLLLAIIVQPARLLLRCRRAFAGSDGPVTLWQRALGPAAWAYFAVAIIALVRTFLANADQRFIDRFGITLLVSLVTGVAFALPVYGVSLGSIWWWGQRIPSTPQGPNKDLHRPAAMPAGGRKG